MKFLLAIWKTFDSENCLILSTQIPRLDHDLIFCTLSYDDKQPKDTYSAVK